MTKQEATFYLVLVSIIIGIIAFGGVLYNFQNDEIEPHTHPTLPPPEPFDDSDLMQFWLDQTVWNARMETKIDNVKDLTVENSNDIAALHPTGPTYVPPTDPDIVITPRLTITTDKAEYKQGDTIILSGLAQYGDPIFVTVLLVEGLNAVDTDRLAEFPTQNGIWRIEYETALDAPVGKWQAWVGQKQEQTQPIKFIVDER